MDQPQPSFFGQRPNFLGQTGRQLADGKPPDRRDDQIGLQLGNIEQRIQQALKGFRRRLDFFDDFQAFLVMFAPGQDVDKHGQRLHRLAQVVAGGGKEAAFGSAGFFGLILGLGQDIIGLFLAGHVLDHGEQAFDRSRR